MVLAIEARIGSANFPPRPVGITRRLRLWIAFGCSVVLLSMGAAQARGSVTVADPRSYPHFAQRARITVLFDGNPIAEASVNVRKFGDNGAVVSDPVATLSTDSKGQTILPEMPEGYYQISSWSSRNPRVGVGFSVCIGACLDPFAIVDLTVVNLDGDVEPVLVDEAAGISEFRIEIDPSQFPSRAQLIAEAESQPIDRTLHEFRGTVVDPTGTPIRGASISVVQRGKQGGEEIALLRADDKGAFAATLPEGRYTVLVAASGFESQATPIAIVPAGDTSTFQIALKPGHAN
jgi:hypothetical protein